MNEAEMVIFEQNHEAFRSLNELMWKIPMVAMTLTGGVWTWVSKVSEHNKLIIIFLLILAVLGNTGLIFALLRMRFVMGKYLDVIKTLDTKHFVDATGGKWYEKPKTIVRIFSSLLGYSAFISFVMMFFV